jgi:hypothetical protein
MNMPHMYVDYWWRFVRTVAVVAVELEGQQGSDVRHEAL